MAIRSFSDRAVEDFFVHGTIPRRAGWGQTAKIAGRKLDMLHYAHRLDDLRSPPGNRLEVLGADLKGYHGIRINDQWRIVFKWTPYGPAEVRIVDYH